MGAVPWGVAGPSLPEGAAAPGCVCNAAPRAALGPAALRVAPLAGSDCLGSAGGPGDRASARRPWASPQGPWNKSAENQLAPATCCSPPLPRATPEPKRSLHNAHCHHPQWGPCSTDPAEAPPGRGTGRACARDTHGAAGHAGVRLPPPGVRAVSAEAALGGLSAGGRSANAADPGRPSRGPCSSGAGRGARGAAEWWPGMGPRVGVAGAVRLGWPEPGGHCRGRQLPGGVEETSVPAFLRPAPVCASPESAAVPFSPELPPAGPAAAAASGVPGRSGSSLACGPRCTLGCYLTSQGSCAFSLAGWLRDNRGNRWFIVQQPADPPDRAPRDLPWPLYAVRGGAVPAAQRGWVMAQSHTAS